MLSIHSICIDSENHDALSDFYARLLGWPRTQNNEHYACVAKPGAPFCLFFQTSEGCTPPTWPEAAGKQQQMLHMDFTADDVDTATNHALACGARKAPAQYMDSGVTMLDPAGHPFCICKA